MSNNFFSKQLSRRTTFELAAGGLSTFLIPRQITKANISSQEPHFLLMVVMEGGMDNSYLFDARPLEMTTKDNLIQNYFLPNKMEAERKIWQGKNGHSTFATTATDILRPYQNNLTILNGVLMANGFDGHEQNENFLFSGNPFGGDSFLIKIAETMQHLPLQYLMTDNSSFGLDLNLGLGVQLEPKTAIKLSQSMTSMPGLKENKILEAIRERYKINAQYRGEQESSQLFSKGSAQLDKSINNAASISANVKQINFEVKNDKNLENDLRMIGEYFNHSLCGIAMMSNYSNDYDTHDLEDAKRQPDEFKSTASNIKTILDFLKNTPAQGTNGKSLFDVTTIVITSEFSRTMRQLGKAIDRTGTDHNPLNNTVILAGKGIKPGLVIGESDFRSSNEQLSGAHKQMELRDKNFLKVMGKPFDFSNLAVSNELPEQYNVEHYLTFTSIANTLLKLFGVADTHLLKVTTRSTKIAKALDNLIG